MMRALYSGVSGVKVHQSKMDVIGNNIANVNTIGFKASTANFSDTYYQMTASATGPNNETGTAGTNAMQIGLGADLAAITSNITTIGGTQRTDRNLDLMINGDAFFVVDSGGQRCFTRSGALNVDTNGTLYCTSNGAKLLGWQADDRGNIVKDTVTPLSVMSTDRMTSSPTATTKATLSGNIDRNDKQVAYDETADGYPITIGFYDNLGNSYMAKLNLMHENARDMHTYRVSFGDLLGADGKSTLYNVTYDELGNKIYEKKDPAQYVSFGGEEYTYEVDRASGKLTWTPAQSATILTFNGSNGEFQSVMNDGEEGETVDLIFNPGGAGGGAPNDPFPIQGISIDFSKLTMYSTQGTTRINGLKGGADGGDGSGNTAGTLSGFTIQGDGKIYGVYSNGDQILFGQIALATFPNPSGLEAIGDSLYRTTLNSGEFDGIGVDPSTVKGFTTGALEMSNVDLANEFTTMITTQRGFQANSRIITTSDTLLEELVNLKR